MREIWKPVTGFENDYLISDRGRLWNLRTNTITTGSACRISGYIRYSLYKNGITKTKSAHLLVAQAFIDNPESKPHIHHINGDKTDNSVSNLQWVTPYEHGKYTSMENKQKEVLREERWQEKLEEISCLKMS